MGQPMSTLQSVRLQPGDNVWRVRPEGAEERYVLDPRGFCCIEKCRHVIGEVDAHDGSHQVDPTNAVEGRGVAVALDPVEGDVSTGACGRTDLQAAVDEVGNDAGAGFDGRNEHEYEEVSPVHDLYSEILP